MSRTNVRAIELKIVVLELSGRNWEPDTHLVESLNWRMWEANGDHVTKRGRAEVRKRWAGLEPSGEPSSAVPRSSTRRPTLCPIPMSIKYSPHILEDIR